MKRYESSTGTGVITLSRIEPLTKITRNRVEVMRVLRKEAAARPSEVAEQVEKSQSAVSRTLSRMQEQGWIEQADVEIGGRSVTDISLYQLTLVGNDVLDAVEDFVENAGENAERD